MGNQKAACLLDGGYEDSEFRVPYDALKKAGCQVEIIGMKAGAELKGYKGKELVKVDKSIDEVKAGEYAALPPRGKRSGSPLTRHF